MDYKQKTNHKKGLFSHHYAIIDYKRIRNIGTSGNSLWGKGCLAINCYVDLINYPTKFFIKGKHIERGGILYLAGLQNPEETKNKILKFVKSAKKSDF